MDSNDVSILASNIVVVLGKEKNGYMQFLSTDYLPDEIREERGILDIMWYPSESRLEIWHGTVKSFQKIGNEVKLHKSRPDWLYLMKKVAESPEFVRGVLEEDRA